MPEVTRPAMYGAQHPIEAVGRNLREMFAWRPQDKDYTEGSAAR
jgi:ketol-acid reductoisomerase